MNPTVTNGKEPTITFQVDDQNRRACYIKRATGWSGIECYTLQPNSFTVIDVDSDLAEALDKILAKNTSKATNYTVVAVSSNTNSFGLHSILILSASGEGWELLKSSDLPKAGDEFKFETLNGTLVLPRFHSYECPRQLPKIESKQATKLIKSIKQVVALRK